MAKEAKPSMMIEL